MANAGVSTFINLESRDHHRMNRYGFNQERQTKQNQYRMRIPGDAVGPITQLPFVQFIVKNLKAPTADELLVGFNRKLFRNIFVSATYAHRKHNHSPYPILTARGRTRSYDGLELAIDKRISSRGLLRFSSTVQNQKIYFPSDSRNLGRSYQDSTNISFANENLPAKNYVRNLGWDWSIKANAAYLLPYKLLVGASFEIVNGLIMPIWSGPPLFGNSAEGNFRKPLEGLNTASLNVVKYTDLRIQRDFAFRKYGKVSVSADVFNVFNMNPRQTLKGNVPSVQFLQPEAIVNPRVFSFELRYNY
jgi:hypothetical protein